jgi:hypothetical protein
MMSITWGVGRDLSKGEDYDSGQCKRWHSSAGSHLLREEAT